MANKLKPCPFCGSEVWFNHNMELEPDGIHCQQCGFVIRWLGVRAKPGEKFEVVMKKIAEKWNRRGESDGFKQKVNTD